MDKFYQIDQEPVPDMHCGHVGGWGNFPHPHQHTQLSMAVEAYELM